jgi:hypothetical protein
MLNETHRTPPRYKISDSFSSLLDNSRREAPARFDALSGIYDRSTIRHLEDRGVSERWRCLEVVEEELRSPMPILAEEISENPCCSGNREGLDGFAPSGMTVGVRDKQRYPHE